MPPCSSQADAAQRSYDEALLLDLQYRWDFKRFTQRASRHVFDAWYYGGMSVWSSINTGLGIAGLGIGAIEGVGTASGVLQLVVEIAKGWDDMVRDLVLEGKLPELDLLDLTYETADKVQTLLQAKTIQDAVNVLSKGRLFKIVGKFAKVLPWVGIPFDAVSARDNYYKKGVATLAFEEDVKNARTLYAQRKMEIEKLNASVRAYRTCLDSSGCDCTEPDILDRLFDWSAFGSTPPLPRRQIRPRGYDASQTSEGSEVRYIPNGQNLPYRVEFWNKPEAVVATQDAVIEDTLDPNVFDLSTFQFTRIGFLKWDVPLPADRRSRRGSTCGRI